MKKAKPTMAKASNVSGDIAAALISGKKPEEKAADVKAIADKAAAELGEQPLATAIQKTAASIAEKIAPESTENFVFEIPSVHAGKVHMVVAASPEQAAKIAAQDVFEQKIKPKISASELETQSMQEKIAAYVKAMCAMYLARKPVKTVAIDGPAQMVGRNMDKTVDKETLQ